MTKEAYYDMCEALGSEPIDDEVPIEYDDLLLEVQEALSIYSKLRDDWDGMNGVYLGKNYSGIMDIFSVLEVEDKRTIFELILIIDKCRQDILESKRPKTSKKPL